MDPHILVISDFNADNLAALLGNDVVPPSASVMLAPFGQTYQVLTDNTHPAWDRRPDALVVWTQPHHVIGAFARALDLETVDPASVLAEVEQFASRVLASRSRAQMILVPTWVIPPWERGLGLTDLTAGRGVRALLARMNQHLAEVLLAGSPRGDVIVLDAHAWVAAAGPRAFSPKGWYLGKIPFAPEVFRQAVASIKASMRLLHGAPRKLIILDLDGTLWGGIVGEVGWENLTVGGHDGDGEAFLDFQRALKRLARTGVLLGIVSKNDERVALSALGDHPAMLLRPSDFVGWRINWADKAENVAALTAELNLGLQSVVFIDDNPAERARVRDALPEVFVPDWPTDPALYRKALLELTCFDALALTSEDRARTSMYHAERERKAALTQVGSPEAWLATLEMVVVIEPLRDANLPRAVQLLNKTNQMNLTTRRLSAEELRQWASEPANHTWTLSVRDKFGDLGLTGLISISLVGATRGAPMRCRVVDFLLSCRVMGRELEEHMLAFIVDEARHAGAATVEAELVPTEKNRPCLEFFRRSRWDEAGDAPIFSWPTSQPYAEPSHYTVRRPDPGDRREVA